MTMYSESLRAFLKPVLPYMDDNAVSEIMINGPSEIWIERKGKVFRVPETFSEEGLLGAARNMAQFVGRVLSEERPRLDARLPDGSRIHVVIAPIARKGTTISIRKFFKDKLTVDALIKYKSMTPAMARLIDAGIHTKLNMLVSGGTGSGKTTLLNIVSSLIPDDERIITIEDSAELQLNQPHIVPFESRPPDKFGKGAVDMGELLASSLRLRPDRIVVGEVRGGEAFYLVQAMNTGHGGSLATTHANTPTDTLRRIESLCLMSAVDLPMVAVRAQVASAINFVVCCERLHDGSRKTIALSEVLPLTEKGEYRTNDIFVFTPVGKDADGHIFGYHATTGIIPNFAAKAKAYGFADLDEKFFDPATYGVPAPPNFRVGTDVETHWAPSLKHRETGDKDPAHMKDEWDAFEIKLRSDFAAEQHAKAEAEKAGPGDAIGYSAPKAAAGAVPEKKVQVQVPANAPVGKPGASAAKPAAAPAKGGSDDDKTPPPTRNPLLAKREPVSEKKLEAAAEEALQPMTEEPKVEISPELLEEGIREVNTDIKALPPPKRPSGVNVQRPVSNLVRPVAAAAPLSAPKRPAPVKAADPEIDDSMLGEDGDEIPDSEKTNIKPMPDPARRR